MLSSIIIVKMATTLCLLFHKHNGLGRVFKSKEKINFKIMELLRDEGIELAVPTRTIHLQDSRDT